VLEVPVIAKSVGSGIAPSTAARLVACGVAAIDVAGAGGTSWALVEGRRAEDPQRERIAEAFGDWGYPTPAATAALREALPALPLVASGGVRNGVHVAKALALGADLVGLALPFLRAAEESDAAVAALIDELVTALRIALFATGSRTLRDLREALA
jgi:isopentenyl-diphosphate delta-isomerase